MLYVAARGVLSEATIAIFVRQIGEFEYVVVFGMTAA